MPAPLRRVKGILLDVDYRRGPVSVIELFVRTEKGLEVFSDPGFKPYFYVIVEGDLEKAKKELLEKIFQEGRRIRNALVEKKRVGWKKKEKEVLKLEFDATQDVSTIRQEVAQFPFVVEKREYDIPFGKRYAIDKGLEPSNFVELEVNEKGEVQKILGTESCAEKFHIGAIDLETSSGDRFSDPKQDPILMIAYADERENQVLTTQRIPLDYVKTLGKETDLIEECKKILAQKKLDIIATYNGDNFDFPYLVERSRKLGTVFDIGYRNTEPRVKRRGRDNAAQVRGIQHMDAYQMVRILARFQVFDLIKFDLESVAESLFGVKKEKIKADDINKIWKEGKPEELARLADYNRLDAVYTHKIVESYLPIFAEFARITRQSLFDANRASSSQLVESLLFIKSAQENMLVPNKPDEGMITQRMMQSYEGGYVKEPQPGLHENLAVLDFSSLHPTIMISHNVSPDTLNCPHERCRENLSPSGAYFCREEKGFLSSILQDLFEKRIQWKEKLKTMPKESAEYKIVHARQYSLKILLNSFYGSLAYARFRWYSRECASAVTAWSRQYVQMVAQEAEKEGFEAIYGDTDSAFLKIPDTKKQEDVKAFVEKINEELPGVMNLELEGFYKRGIFVTKKAGEKAAKKKYALMDAKGGLKIVGFEYVRRDWANVAKRTQKDVLAAVLAEGNPERAVQIVKKVIQELKSGKTPKEDLVIYSQIKKNIDQYESIGPHVAAAKKAIAKGKDVGEGSIIGYVVTRSGKTISEKAQLTEYVGEGNYDSDYYISHQVVPAVIKIIQELGYTEEDLIQGGKQSALSAFGG